MTETISIKSKNLVYFGICTQWHNFFGISVDEVCIWQDFKIKEVCKIILT